ncbi:sugar transferase [Brevirhabdus sp.]|uniref:sugar transferase n=1 Tax=Brevirhabdus sp. TaxID=2004514 RepID=UPI004059025E
MDMRHVFWESRLSAASDRLRKVRRYHDGPKRWLDVGLTLMVGPFLLPVVALLWGVIRLQGGPGFYGHPRMGRDGRMFRCWKLRTMVPDARARLRAHLRADPAAAREWAMHYKLARDPRITPLGRFLRASSLDELPQLWNVLRGEMSLVGPRPVTQSELSEYAGMEWAYLNFRPGLTGLWQISGRNALAYRKRVRLDAAYQLEMGLKTDLRILLQTLPAMWRHRGV